MRHRKTGRRLDMDSAQRKSLFRNMATSLVVHGFVRTTVARAKELTVRAFERHYISKMLEKTSGNISAAAIAAGMDRSNFRRAMKECGLRE